MGAQKCPNCEKGFLLGKGSKPSKRYRCNQCGYTKYPGPHKRGRDVIPRIPDNEPMESTSFPKIPIVESEDVIQEKKGTEKYQIVERERAQWIREQRKEVGIRKMLRNLKKNKYNKIKIVTIAGRVWDVETGKELGIKGEYLTRVEAGDELG